MSTRTKVTAALVLASAVIAAVLHDRFGRNEQPRPEPELPPPVALVFGNFELSSVVNSEQAKRLGWDMRGDLQVTPEGFILLQSGGTIVNVVGGEPILTQPCPDLRSFATVGEGVVAICGKHLCSYAQSKGTLEPVVELPSDRMQVAGAGDASAFYLWENTAAGGDVYAFSSGGSYSKLIHTDRPILAITGSGGRIFFSVWNRIFTWKQGETVSLVLDLAKALGAENTAPITSLTIDPKTGLVFFSCGDAVYALSEGALVLLLAGCSGDLQFARDRLFVKDRVQQAILQVTGVREALMNRNVEKSAK